MLSIDALPDEVCGGLRGILCDIDDTLTDGGKLSAGAYAALWTLREAGLHVIPVTGRPAGWCDLIARQWPVDAVIGENGALAFYEEKGRMHRMTHPSAAEPARRGKLAEIERAVLAEVVGSRVSQDQAYRAFDLAIDFCEEPPDLGLEAAEQIRAIFERYGAHAKVSSIHVNGWFGDYDKLGMTRLFLRARWGYDLEQEAERSRWIFVGDSPNDEPMFAFFPHACAVANIAPFAETLTHLPRYVTRQRGGAGFAQVAARILAQRGAGQKA